MKFSEAHPQHTEDVVLSLLKSMRLDDWVIIFSAMSFKRVAQHGFLSSIIGRVG
jgi:hypothetical protein